jgi:hypothetical protein
MIAPQFREKTRRQWRVRHIRAAHEFDLPRSDPHKTNRIDEAEMITDHDERSSLGQVFFARDRQISYRFE